MTPYEGVHVVNNTDAVLKCTLCAIPGFSFTWMKSGGVLPPGRTNASDCALFISKARMEDTGNYTCIGKARSGTSSLVLREDIRLTVRGLTLAALVKCCTYTIITVQHRWCPCNQLIC